MRNNLKYIPIVLLLFCFIGCNRDSKEDYIKNYDNFVKDCEANSGKWGFIEWDIAKYNKSGWDSGYKQWEPQMTDMEKAQVKSIIARFYEAKDHPKFDNEQNQSPASPNDTIPIKQEIPVESDPSKK